MPWNSDRPNGTPNPWGVPPTGGGREPPGDRGPGRPGGPRGPWGGGAAGRAQYRRGHFARPGFRPQLSAAGPGRRRAAWGHRFSGGRGALLLLAIVAALWLASGFYRVEPDEQGVVLRFGAYTRTTLPGLNYHLPWPIETVQTPAVTRINRVEVGYRSNGGERVEEGTDTSGRDVLQESLMLTGDENIVDIDFAVFWRIRDAFKYLFNTRNPDHTVKQIAESVMREVIGRTPIQDALTTNGRYRGGRDERRASSAGCLRHRHRDHPGAVAESRPAGRVIESFRDVQRANTDADRARNDAQSYATTSSRAPAATPPPSRSPPTRSARRR